MNIGFIGLGKMGVGIAGNLLAAGNALTVYNRSADKAKPLTDKGARLANSPAEAAKDAEAVITMLSNDEAVSAVVWGKDGLLDSLPAAANHLSCSTISVDLTRKLTAEHSSKNQGFLSIPVFGRPQAAANKQLIVVVGGNPDLAAKFQSLFDSIGRLTTYIGEEPWQANAVKLGGNFMIAAMLETFGETFATLRKAGIDHHKFLEVMGELFGSPIYKNYGKIVADRQWDPPAFALDLGFKDIRQMADLAQGVEAPMPLASLLKDRFLEGMANGQSALDWSSIAQLSAKAAGLKD